MRTVLIHTHGMDVAAAPVGLALNPGYVSLSALAPGSAGLVVGVGTPNAPMSSLERRLLELGFFSGEEFEILAEAWPGHDPFVVRIGNTTLALRRREAESVWVELSRPKTVAPSPTVVASPAQ
jgi:ferrous iron transport protein A